MRRSLAIALLAFGLAACQATTNPQAPTGSVSEVAQALSPVGQQVDFLSLTRDRVVLVDVWATWCKECKETMPRVQLLSERHGGESLVVVGVNVGETANDVQAYTGEAGVSYPQYLDKDFRFADLVGASEIPMFLVVDRSGTIVHRAAGLDQGVLEALDRELGR